METHGTFNSPRASEKRKPQIRTRKGVGVRRCWEERGANASWEQGRRFLPDAGADAAARTSQVARVQVAHCLTV